MDQLILVSRMDKLTAKAPRMVPWHSLVSASRACEEDLEPDAVPEAVPEADGDGFVLMGWGLLSFKHGGFGRTKLVL